MRRFMASGLAVGACLLWSANAHAAEAIKWATSLDKAIATAKASNKLVMADFYTDW